MHISSNNPGIFKSYYSIVDSDGKACVYNAGDPGSTLGREDLLEKEMAVFPTPVFVPGKLHGRRNLLGYSPWGRKESDTTEQLHVHV